MIIKYNVLKNATSIFVMMMLVMLLMEACSEFNYSEIRDISNQTGSIPRTQRVITIYREATASQTGVSPTLKTRLIVPGTVTKPKAIENTVKGKVTVTATAPTDLGKKVDGTSVNAEEIKYALYYARYGHSYGNITVDGGTSIEDIASIVHKAKNSSSVANKDAGIIRITGNNALTTTGFVISSLSADMIYRYFIRSIHPDDASKYTDTVTRLAFVLNPRTVQVIPHGETSIDKKAFISKSLTSVSIPDSVTSVGIGAFYGNALTSVSIPDSVTSIGDTAFGRNALTSVTIGNSVTSIGSFAFAYNNFTSVTIPDSVESIGEYAFASDSLTSVTLSETLYKKIKATDDLNKTFGDKVAIYQDHAEKKLN